MSGDTFLEKVSQNTFMENKNKKPHWVDKSIIELSNKEQSEYSKTHNIKNYFNKSGFAKYDRNYYNRDRKQYWNKKRKIYCGNCGKIGHMYRECNGPITSCGIIAYKRKYKQKDTELVFLLIRRRNTIPFIDITRGKFNYNNKQLVQNYFENITEEEHEQFKTLSHDEIWEELWVNKKSKIYTNEKRNAAKKYNKLPMTEFLKIKPKIKSLPWGFPKGRRNLHENDLTCALREFKEETNYESNKCKILNVNPVYEDFKGTNNVDYRHIYFIAEFISDEECKIDPNNISQTGEISAIGWFKFEECLNLISEDHKKAVLIEVNQLLADYTDRNLK